MAAEPDRSGLATLRRYVSTHPLLADALGAGLFYLVILVPSLTRAAHSFGPRTAFLAIPLCLALAFRRRWPIPVLVVVTAVALTAILAGEPPPALVGCLIAVYTVASRTSRRTSVIGGLAAAAALSIGTLVSSNEPPFDARNVILVAWTGMAMAAGDAVRNRRAYVAAIEERARRAEQTRDEEARRRVVEERLRIARELHDVVAHSIALINVQSGVASHLLREHPEAADEALRHVRRASQTVLDELGTMLSVLRQPDDADSPLDPAPSLKQLDDLVDTFREVGLAVRQSVSGQPRELAPTVGLAAYRIAQESLTNAHKHGSAARASLEIVYEPETLLIIVRNPAPPTAKSEPVGTGHGLVGMRERAAAAGGHLTAGWRAGGFEVRADLPAATRKEPEALQAPFH